jgi:predicted DNA binding protein
VKHPGSKIWHWCNSKVHFAEIRGQGALEVARSLRRLAKDVGKAFKLESFAKRDGVVVTASGSCPCYFLFQKANSPLLSFQFDRFRCVSIEPVIHENGWEYFKIAAPGSVELRGLLASLDQMGELEVLLKRQYRGDFAHNAYTLSVAELFHHLTEKQRCALVNALDNGYYTIPRRTTVGKLAGAKGVPRTTFEEHLHKAESKVLLSLSPYLRVFDQT